MRFIRSTTGLVVAVAGCATARSTTTPDIASDSAMYVVKLGADTSFVQWMTLHGNSVHIDVIERIPRVRYLRTQATLYSDGTVENLERIAYLPGIADTSPVERMTIRFIGDSTIFETATHSTRSRYATPGRSHLAVGAYNVVGFPVLAHYVPGKVGDSIVSPHLGGFYGDRKLVLRRVARDTFTVTGLHIGMVRVHIGADGRSDGYNAMGSLFNTIAKRAEWLPVDSVERSFVQIERARGIAGVASPRDTVRGNVGGAVVTIDYSRPSRRGRQIFGGIVPWNAVWRTGANDATELRTDRTLIFGSSVLPAGRYTLWTVPTPGEWTLVVNNQTDLWGTDYDPSFDRFRIPMTVSTLAPPVEKFTIVIDSSGVAPVLRLRWDTVEASVPFTVGS